MLARQQERAAEKNALSNRNFNTTISSRRRRRARGPPIAIRRNRNEEDLRMPFRFYRIHLPPLKDGERVSSYGRRFNAYSKTRRNTCRLKSYRPALIMERSSMTHLRENSEGGVEQESVDD